MGLRGRDAGAVRAVRRPRGVGAAPAAHRRQRGRRERRAGRLPAAAHQQRLGAHCLPRPSHCQISHGMKLLCFFSSPEALA